MSFSDVEIYSALARAFGSLSVRWYVFGAQAAILHGAVRFTEDVDVTVEIGDRPHRALADALLAEGFALRNDDDAFVEQTRVLPIFHRATNTPVDVVLAGRGIEELFFDGAIQIAIEGLNVPVARAEDIVVMKILAGRPKDLEDVVAILSAQGPSFDPQRTLWLLGLLEQALDQSDLLPVFERCRARANG
jgi:hypothetical protein